MYLLDTVAALTRGTPGSDATQVLSGVVAAALVGAPGVPHHAAARARSAAAVRAWALAGAASALLAAARLAPAPLHELYLWDDVAALLAQWYKRSCSCVGPKRGKAGRKLAPQLRGRRREGVGAVVAVGCRAAAPWVWLGALGGLLETVLAAAAAAAIGWLAAVTAAPILQLGPPFRPGLSDPHAQDTTARSARDGRRAVCGRSGLGWRRGRARAAGRRGRGDRGRAGPVGCAAGAGLRDRRAAPGHRRAGGARGRRAAGVRRPGGDLACCSARGRRVLGAGRARQALSSWRCCSRSASRRRPRRRRRRHPAARSRRRWSRSRSRSAWPPSTSDSGSPACTATGCSWCSGAGRPDRARRDRRPRRAAAPDYRRLVEHAERTQAGLRTDLRRLRIGFRPYYLVNGVEVDGGPAVRAWLARRVRCGPGAAQPGAAPAAGRAEPAARPAPAPDGPLWNVEMVGADRVWEARQRARAPASSIGSSDSGVDGTHPALAGRLPRRRRLLVRPVERHPRPHRPQRPRHPHARHARSAATASASRRTPPGSAASTSTATSATRRATWTACSSCSRRSRTAATRSATAGRSAPPHVLTNSWGCPRTRGLRPAASCARPSPR